MSFNSGNNKTFLDRLNSIVEANLGDEQFGVSELAKETGLNRSRLYIKVKSLTQKSVSQFIREHRLNKALELLRQTQLHVSEVSYKVGFSSPAYFNKCFHEQFGYPPGETKSHIQTGAESNEKTNETNIVEHKASKQLSARMVVFISILILFGAFLLYQTFSRKPLQNNPDFTSKSIAVLPLKNISNNPDIQYLADGIMEDILTRLSYVDGLVVKSRISSEKIGDENLTAKEIAKQLNVGYFLEGSILPVNNKIRINVQLISAKEDKHVWANHFDKDLTEILPFITEVSRQITEQLEIILSPEEVEQVGKNYTENKDAFLLYQKGRFFWHRRGEENLKLSIQYFNQALELDSTYALAYAGLADVYMILPFHTSCSNDESYSKTIEYANKALSIDSSLDEPHVAIAGAETYYKLNWEVAEKEFLRAIKLNSNNADAYQFYAEYLHLMCKHAEARTNVNKAIELDPNANMKYWVSAFLYYDEGKYEESIKALQKMKEFGVKLDWVYRQTFQNYIHLEESEKVLETYLKYLEYVPHDSDYRKQVEDIFEITGICGILEYEISRLKKQSLIDYKWIAKYYAMLENEDSTLFYLEKEFESPQAEGVMDIKVWIDFQFLRGNPGYNALLEKANLPVN